MAFLGGPGVALPNISGTLGGGVAGALPLAGRNFAQLHDAVDSTLGIRWGLIRGRQKKLQNIASDALSNLTSPTALGAANLEHVRRVFRVIASEMKRDGDALTIQQCEEAFKTQRAAIRSLQAQRKAYTQERLALQEKMPDIVGADFEKSEALQLIDDQIKEAKDNLNTLGFAVLTSMCYGVKDVSYESLPKVRAEYNRMLKLYYQINGKPAIGGAPAEEGMMQKLDALTLTTDEATIRAERVLVSPQAQIKAYAKKNGKEFGISVAAGLIPDAYNLVSNLPLVGRFVPGLGSGSDWMARVACMSVAYGIQWLMQAPA